MTDQVPGSMLVSPLFVANGNVQLYGGASGVLTLSNATNTSWDRLQFGGTTSSFPALKRSGTQLQARLADDSAYSDVHANSFVLNNGSTVTDLSDGIVRISNATNASFTRLNLGPASTSFPALKTSGSTLQVRLGDDSNFAPISASNGTFSGTVSAFGSIFIDSNIYTGSTASAYTIGANPVASIGSGGYVQLWGSTSATPGLVVIGNANSTVNLTTAGLLSLAGTSASFPAFKRNGAIVAVRLADDSADASISAGAATFSSTVNATGTITSSAHLALGATSAVIFSGRSQIWSGADGNVMLSNSATNDFGRLQFGGTTSSFPALKRNAAGLDLRLADDSGYGTFNAGSINAASAMAVGGSAVVTQAMVANATIVRTGNDNTDFVTANAITLAQVQQTLTFANAITWDATLGFNAKVTLANSAGVLGAITNVKEGLTYALQVKQPVGGNCTVAWNSAYDFGSAGTPTLSTTANSVDFAFAYCYDATSPKFRTSFSKAA